MGATKLSRPTRDADESSLSVVDAESDDRDQRGDSLPRVAAIASGAKQAARGSRRRVGAGADISDGARRDGCYHLVVELPDCNYTPVDSLAQVLRSGGGSSGAVPQDRTRGPGQEPHRAPVV